MKPIITDLCQRLTDTDKVLRVFISQPMKDKTEESIYLKRKQVEATLIELGAKQYTIIESFFKDAYFTIDPLCILGESLKLLSSADVVYFTEGWDKARGCKLEYEAWVSYLAPRGIPCYTEYKDSYERLYVVGGGVKWQY